MMIIFALHVDGVYMYEHDVNMWMIFRQTKLVLSLCSPKPKLALYVCIYLFSYVSKRAKKIFFEVEMSMLLHLNFYYLCSKKSLSLFNFI